MRKQKNAMHIIVEASNDLFEAYNIVQNKIDNGNHLTRLEEEFQDLQKEINKARKQLNHIQEKFGWITRFSSTK